VCNACSALEIDCLYGDDKPVFMDNGPLQKEKADWLKQEVKLRATRRRERRYLQALELGIETLDVSQVEADESDPSNDSSILPTADPTTSPSSTKPESSQTSSPGQQDEVRHQQMPAMSLPTRLTRLQIAPKPCSSRGGESRNASCIQPCSTSTTFFPSCIRFTALRCLMPAGDGCLSY